MDARSVALAKMALVSTALVSTHSKTPFNPDAGNPQLHLMIHSTTTALTSAPIQVPLREEKTKAYGMSNGDTQVLRLLTTNLTYYF